MSLAVFPFRADWTSPIVERWAWSTSVMESNNGTEQRYGLTPTPRYGLRARVQAPEIGRTIPERASFLTRAIASVMGREILYPLWHQAVIVPTSLAGGATTLTVDTTGREFEGAPSLLFWRDPFTYYSVTQGTYNASTLTFGALPGAVAAGTWRVYPLYRGRLLQSTEVTTDGIPAAQVMVDFDTGPTLAAADPDPDPFLSPRPNRRTDLTAAFSLADRLLDYGIGRRSVVARRAPTETAGYEFSLDGFPAIHAFRRWLFARRGRQVSFRMPSHQGDYRLMADAADGAETLTVARCGHAETVSGNVDLIILKANRVDWSIVTVTGSTPAGDTEVLALSAPLPDAIPRSTVWGIYRLHTCRLDADQVELAHIKQNHADVSIPIRRLS